jgi:hypothetical protein
MLAQVLPTGTACTALITGGVALGVTVTVTAAEGTSMLTLSSTARLWRLTEPGHPGFQM